MSYGLHDRPSEPGPLRVVGGEGAPGHASVPGAGATWPFPPRSRYLRSVVRSARLLAGADASAIVSCHSALLRVELGEPGRLLPRGTVAATHPALMASGVEGAGHGHRQFQWAPTAPPIGFSYAYLLDGAALQRRGLLLLVANIAEPVPYDRLRLVSARLWLAGGAPGLRPVAGSGEAPVAGGAPDEGNAPSNEEGVEWT